MVAKGTFAFFRGTHENLVVGTDVKLPGCFFCVVGSRAEQEGELSLH